MTTAEQSGSIHWPLHSTWRRVSTDRFTGGVRQFGKGTGLTRITISKMCQGGRVLDTYSAIIPVLLMCVFLFPQQGNAQQAQPLRSNQPEKMKALPVEKVRVETIRITGNSIASWTPGRISWGTTLRRGVETEG